MLFDSELAAESEYEAEQRRGRERMLGMWRTAVQSLVEAAQHQAALRGDQPAADASEDADDEQGDGLGTPTATWVFPARPAPGPSGN